MSIRAAAERARRGEYSWEICSASAAVFFIHLLFLSSQITTCSRGQEIKWALVVLLSWRRNGGEHNAPYTHTDALNHSWQKGPSLLMCVKRLQGFCDFVFVMLFHFKLNFTRVAFLICDYTQVPHQFLGDVCQLVTCHKSSFLKLAACSYTVHFHVPIKCLNILDEIFTIFDKGNHIS